MIFWPLRLAIKITSIVLTLLLIYFAITFVQIWLTGRERSTANAQAILVFGTAELNGTPSAELTDRLNEALALFDAGRAPLIVVTGGKRPGDVYTEAGVSAAYLVAHGVPKADIIQGGGGDTWANVASVLPALRAQHVTTVLTVTDPFHEYRAMAICSAQGLSPQPDPVTKSALTGGELLQNYAVETLEVGVARVFGYHTVSDWIHDG